MKEKVNHLLLALLFGLFAFFAVLLSPGVFTTIDQVAIFFFGAMSGIQLHMFWLAHANSSADVVQTGHEH